MGLIKTLIILVFTSVSFFIIPLFGGTTNKMKKDLKLVIQKVEKDLKEKYDLKIVGSGGSMPGGELHYISFHMCMKKKLNIEEARKILLNCTRIYLDAFNSCEGIRSEMVKFPFDEQNCDISIFFQNPDGSYVQHPFLINASNYKGKFRYSTKDDGKNEFGYESQYIESYQEALEKLKACN